MNPHPHARPSNSQVAESLHVTIAEGNQNAPVFSKLGVALKLLYLVLCQHRATLTPGTERAHFLEPFLLL